MQLEKYSLFSDAQTGKTPDGKRIPPKEFRLFRAGLNPSQKGDFVFDAESAEAVLANWKVEGNDLMGDYNHEDGGPAACTYFELEVRNGELWATNVSWTPKAFKALEDGEYRLYSPTFLAQRETKRIVKLVAFALTNRPALYNLTPLVEASANDAELLARAKEHSHMDETLKQQNAALTAQVAALSAELASSKAKASDGEMVALSMAIGVAKPADALPVATALVALRSDLLVETGAKSAAEALGKVKAWKEDASEVAGLRGKLADLEQVSLTAELDAVLKKANDEARVSPAKRDAVRAMAIGADGKVSKELLVKLTAFVGALTPLGTTVIGAASGDSARPGEEHVALTANTASQKAVNEAMGVDNVAFAKWEQDMRAAGRWTGDLARVG